MKVGILPEAIDARLTLTSELLNLCLSPGKAMPVANQSPQKDDQTNTSKSDEPNNK
jgi:hypothetical protein